MLSCVFEVFFSAFFAHSRINLLKLILFPIKLGIQHYLVYVIVLKLLEAKTIVRCLKLHVKLRFLGFLSAFGTFVHRVVQILFVWHETGKTILFGICNCVKRVKIQNNSHMLEITCNVAFFRFFLSVFGIFSHQLVQTCFVSHETWHTTLFVIYYCVEMVRIKNNI